MRHYRRFLSALLWTSLSFSGVVHAQYPWSGIISSGRAINWAQAGLPSSYPDGETTPNPWTPPTRTQCGSTLMPSGNATTDLSNISAALSACTAGHYVLLGPGSFQWNGYLPLEQNGVSLRGSGAMSTTLSATGGGNVLITLGSARGSQTCTWSSGLGAGSTTLGLTGCSAAPTANTLMFLQQCDSGFSTTTSTPCGTGSPADNGGLYICGGQPACNRAGEDTETPQHEMQVVWVTGVTSLGGGAYSVTISNTIAMPNWKAANSPTASWAATYYGIGLEDMTIHTDSNLTSSSYGVYANFLYGGWIKGVRFIGAGGSGSLHENNNKNFLTMNNYIHSRVELDGNYPAAGQELQSSDDLFLNNIMDGSVGYDGLGSSSGLVFAYNYPIWVFTNQETTNTMDHSAGNTFRLYEGNISGGFTEDDTHGTHDLSTWFRNYSSGWYQPYQTNPNKLIINLGEGNRFTNFVGNVFGSTYISLYQMYLGSGTYNFLYGFDPNGSVVNDPLVQSSSFRWANYDTITGGVRYCGSSSSPGWSTTCSSASETPTTLTGNAVSFNNLIPSSTTLPPSFFLPTTVHPSGGTGLNWWKVCTSWTTFPTACATTSTPPFPPIGPDVSGGNAPAASFGTSPGVAGHVYDIPAAIAFIHLPIDTTYQSSYSITSSSWANGTETINISPAFGNVTHVIGGFQVSGGACATAGAGTSTGAEVYITNSTTTSVSYALASNPGNCAGGAMLFPDVRQFDERAYEADSSVVPPAPSSVTGNVVPIP
jgi:hypothetical protein